MTEANSSAPSPPVTCACGCGETPPLATKTDRHKGRVKGQPLKYCPGHYHDPPREPYAGEPVYCACGCGEVTPLWTVGDATYGAVKGQPRKYVPGHYHRKKPLEERYTVDPDTGCWLWAGHINHLGYGTMHVEGGANRFAHCLIYEAHRGPVPDGAELDHLCRTTRCVNPDHLEPVTHAENIRRGEATKLTVDQVRHLRHLASRGTSAKQLAARFGITQTHVYYIVKRQSWRDI